MNGDYLIVAAMLAATALTFGTSLKEEKKQEVPPLEVSKGGTGIATSIAMGNVTHGSGRITLNAPITGNGCVSVDAYGNLVDSGAVCGSTGGTHSLTVAAREWASWHWLKITDGQQTITLPPASTLARSGGIVINTYGPSTSATLVPFANDSINGGNQGSGFSIKSNSTVFVNTDGINKLYTSSVGGSSYEYQTNSPSSFMTGSGINLQPHFSGSGVVSYGAICSTDVRNSIGFTSTMTAATLNFSTSACVSTPSR